MDNDESRLVLERARLAPILRLEIDLWHLGTASLICVAHGLCCPIRHRHPFLRVRNTPTRHSRNVITLPNDPKCSAFILELEGPASSPNRASA